jgi:hypothetical protein
MYSAESILGTEESGLSREDRARKLHAYVIQMMVLQLEHTHSS